VALSGLCLNDSHWVTTPGNEIFLWKCGGSGAEDFSHPKNKGELIAFGQCKTDNNASRGTPVVVDKCTGATDQRWTGG
jgi:Ricin-type beta-trefoil lectin domain